MQGLNKPTKVTLLVLLIVFGGIISWNIIRGILIKRNLAANIPIPAVTTTQAIKSTWQPSLYAVGTLIAVNGVNISTQAEGNVVTINFQSGQGVKKNDFLLQIDDRQEQAQLQNNIAAMKLAQITYERNKALLQQSAISQQAFDQACANYQQAVATVAQTQAIINYKHITAPFDGKLGIRQVNLGQYVKPGDNIVSLQSMDPLYVNFYLPEQHLHQLSIGQLVTLKVDAMPKTVFKGRINALESLVDVQTHNLTVQATVNNKDGKLYPGLFARLRVLLPMKKNVVLVPATAINYTVYGDTIFVVNHQKNADKEILTVSLRDVKTGEERNGQIIITEGIKPGDEVVTSGQLKLTNGQQIIINNTVQP